jgi:hypothetical protein
MSNGKLRKYLMIKTYDLQWVGHPRRERMVVKLWYRKLSKKDLNVRQPKFDTWERLKQGLKEQFLSNNTYWLAYEDLNKMKQEKSMLEYVKEFSYLILEFKKVILTFH